MSDANRVQLSFVEESTFGELKTGSALQILRETGESLKQDTTVVTSGEIRSDRQITDVIRTGRGASGSIDFELSYGTFDAFLNAALLSSAWASEVKLEDQTTMSAEDDDNSLNDSNNGFGSFVANQWVYVSGFTTAANNGWKKILGKSIGKLSFSNGAMVDEIAGDKVTVQQGAYIENGTTLVTYNIEKQFVDLSNIFTILTGMCINQVSLDVPADGIVTGSFGFMGLGEQSAAASSGTGYTAASTTTAITGANHIGAVYENLTSLGILGFTMSLNNSLRTRLQVGTLGAVAVGTGTVEVTGTVQIHFATHTLFDKYLNQTETSLVLAIEGGAGNRYIIDLPAIKLTNGTRLAGGPNTDVIGDFEFSAYMNATEAKTIRIARFPVLTALNEELVGNVINTSSVVTGALTV